MRRDDLKTWSESGPRFWLYISEVGGTNGLAIYEGTEAQCLRTLTTFANKEQRLQSAQIVPAVSRPKLYRDPLEDEVAREFAQGRFCPDDGL